MKLSNLLMLPVAVVAAVVISSCSNEKPYAINGVLNVPSEIPYGDTIISIPSPEGTWVYLVEGEEPIDSCQVVDNRFAFTGTIKADDAHFAQVACMYFMSLVAIEPGDINLYSDGSETHVTGTPSNDGVNGMFFALGEVENYIQHKMQLIEDSLTQVGEEADYQHFMALQEEYNTLQAAKLDSIYEVNQDNLASVYAAVLRHAGDGSSAEFEAAINEYPERVKNNEFVRSCINAMKEQEAAYGGFQLDDSMLIDSEEESAE